MNFRSFVYTRLKNLDHLLSVLVASDLRWSDCVDVVAEVGMPSPRYFKMWWHSLHFYGSLELVGVKRKFLRAFPRCWSYMISLCVERRDE